MLDNADTKQRRAKKDQGCDADGASGQHARTYIRTIQRGQQVDAKESEVCRQKAQQVASYGDDQGDPPFSPRILTGQAA